MPSRILVTGATGTQGGAVVSAFIKANESRSSDPITIHALLRSTSTRPQSYVSESNVKVFHGDFDNIASVRAAAEGCIAAFLNVTPVFTDSQAEARHAHNLVEACASIPSIERIVFSSSGALHRAVDSKVWAEYVDKYPTQWMSQYMKSKRACEEAVINSSTNDFVEGWSVVRPNTFLTNFLVPLSSFMYPDLKIKQSITTALRPDLQISFLDPDDLGPLFARMLTCTSEEWEEQWKHRFVPVAKENMTIGQLVGNMNAALEKIDSAKRVELIQLGDDEAKAMADAGDMVVASQLFQNEWQEPFELEEVKRGDVDVDSMMGVEQYFEKHTEELIGTLGG